MNPTDFSHVVAKHADEIALILFHDLKHHTLVAPDIKAVALNLQIRIKFGMLAILSDIRRPYPK